jgi:hypothetical protein
METTGHGLAVGLEKQNDVEEGSSEFVEKTSL